MSSSRKYHFNTRIFKSIDTPSKAYWLGFLIADGSIRNEGYVRIHLAKKDRNHLVKFRSFLEFKGPIYPIHSYDKSSAEIIICSTNMVKDLKKYGVVQNKTNKVDLPDIEYWYMNHLIRGIFDGDGTIYINNNEQPYWIISGRKILLQSILDFLTNEFNYSFTGPIGIKSHTTCRIQKAAKKAVKDILHYIYKDSTPETRLTRKWNIANKVFKL